MIILSPSLLAADFSNIGDSLRAAGEAGCEYLHLDVMDGVFVPNISFGQPLIASLRKNTALTFDVHLMIISPERYFEDFKKAGADIITFHYEACDSLEDIKDSALRLREFSVSPSIAIKPDTSPEEIFPVLDLFDMALVMSVEPGFGGQAFMPHSLESVRKLKEFRDTHNLNFKIEIDGGVNRENIKAVRDAGVDVVVAGSAVFGSENMTETVRFFKEF